MSHPNLRPLAFGEILDGSFQLYRAHFTPLFLAALVPFAPLIAFYFLIAAAVSFAGSDVTALLMVVSGLLTMPLVALGFFLSLGAITYMVSQLYTGKTATLGESMRYATSRMLALFLATVLSVMLMALGLLLFIVPGIILMGMFFAVGPAVVIERQSPAAALGRSRELARGSIPRILGLLFVATIIAALPAWGLQASVIFAIGIDATEFTRPWLAFAVNSGGQLLSALTWPFSIAALVLLYYDRRVRAEALDVQLAAEQLPVAG
jgi:hypothetical protein